MLSGWSPSWEGGYEAPERRKTYYAGEVKKRDTLCVLLLRLYAIAVYLACTVIEDRAIALKVFMSVSKECWYKKYKAIL